MENGPDGWNGRVCQTPAVRARVRPRVIGWESVPHRLPERSARGSACLPAYPGETLPEYVVRIGTIRAKVRERDQLKAHLAKEKQFNRKVEANAALRTLGRELESLRREPSP